jgi:hypothetical protein
VAARQALTPSRGVQSGEVDRRDADAEVTVPSSMRARLRSISKSISHAQID